MVRLYKMFQISGVRRSCCRKGVEIIRGMRYEVWGVGCEVCGKKFELRTEDEGLSFFLQPSAYFNLNLNFVSGGKIERNWFLALPQTPYRIP
ncbi:MAG: hypothetical protein OHK0040_05770 [bacterium]